MIDAALPRHPTGKPHVERGIQYVRENFFRGETWLDLAHVQREAVRWCREVAGLRVHGTTRHRPLAVFEATEQATLQPLTGPRFDPPIWKRCKAHPDHHVEFAGALYSVPTGVVGHRLWVRGDRALVRIYEAGLLLKTHPRQAAGGRHTDFADYPAHLAPYALRDPQRMTRDPQAQGPAIGTFVERLLAGPVPWARLRQVQKLLRLANRYGRTRVDTACQRALSFDLLNVHRVERIVQQDLARLPATPGVPGGDRDATARPTSFDMLGFTHVWTRSLRGYWVHQAQDRARPAQPGPPGHRPVVSAASPVHVVLGVFVARRVPQVHPTTSPPLSFSQLCEGAGKGVGRHYTRVCTPMANDFKVLAPGLGPEFIASRRQLWKLG